MVMVNRAVHPGCPAGGKRVGFTCNTVEEAVEWQHAMVEAIEQAEDSWYETNATQRCR